MSHPLRLVNRALISLIGVYFAYLTKPQPDEHLLFFSRTPVGLRGSVLLMSILSQRMRASYRD